MQQRQERDADQQIGRPVGYRREAGSGSAQTIGEDLRTHQPEHRPHADGERDDVEQHADQNEVRRLAGTNSKDKADGRQGNHHASGADQQQRPATQAIDKKDGDNGREDIDYANHGGRQDSGRCCFKPGNLKNGRRIIDDRVDAHKLLQDGQTDPHD